VVAESALSRTLTVSTPVNCLEFAKFLNLPKPNNITSLHVIRGQLKQPLVALEVRPGEWNRPGQFHLLIFGIELWALVLLIVMDRMCCNQGLAMQCPFCQSQSVVKMGNTAASYRFVLISAKLWQRSGEKTGTPMAGLRTSPRSWRSGKCRRGHGDGETVVGC